MAKQFKLEVNMAINLLPWREQAHYQRLRLFMFNVLILLSLFLSFYGFLYHQNQQTLSEITTQQQDEQQLNLQLTKLEQKLTQLNQDNSNITTIFSLAQLQQVFQLLNELPLQQGELQQLQWQSDHLTLIGELPNQAEFEQVHQFLLQQPQFKQIKLSQFKPLTEGLFFQFDLQ